MEPFDTSGQSNMEENDQIKEGDVICLHQSEENGNSLQRTSVSDEESSGNAGVETESDKTSGIANETVFSSKEDICDVSVITNGAYGNKLRVLCSNVVDHSRSENEMTKEMSGGGRSQEMENNNPVDACANLTPASAEVTSLAEQKSHINVVNSEDNVTEEPEIELRNGKSQEVVSLCSVNDTLSERSEGILNLKDGPIGDRCLQERTNKAVDACDLISVSEKCTSLEQQRNYIGSVVLEEGASRTEDPVIEVNGMKPEKDVSFSFSENGTHTERRMNDVADGCHQEMTNNKAVDDCDLISLSEKCTSLEHQRNYIGSVVLEEDASKIQDPAIELHEVKLEKDTSFLCSQNETPKELSEGILNVKEIGLIGDKCGQEMTNNKAVDACDLISVSEKCTSLEQQGNCIESVVLQEDASKIEDPVIEVHGMKPEKDTSFLCSRNETPTERFEGAVSLKSADDRDSCSEEVENNNTVNSCAYYTSVLENGTFLEGKKNFIHSVDLEDDVSMIEERKTGLQELKAIQNTAQLPVPQDTGLKVAGVLDSQSISSDSDKAIQVYAMTTMDKELEVISAESSTQRENIKDEASSLRKNSSDSDDESSSSESLTSSDSSSDEELEDIRKEIEREEEKVQVGPLKTKSEILIKELPEVPELDISIDGNVQLVEIGLVFSVVETLVVVRALPCTPALDEESIIFLENRSCLGLVFETFGPVQRPFYSVRFNKESDIKEKNVLVGDKVLYAPDIMEYSHYVFVSQLKKLKGSDASWEHDEEPPVEVIDYSDDEEEARAKSSRKKERVAKRGSAENTSSQKMNEAGGETVHQETQKGNRKRSWKNRAKHQPVNLDLTSNQETLFNNPEAMQKGPMSSHEAVGRPFMDHSTSTQHSVFNNTEAMQRGPMSWHKPRFAPPAVGRPFMDHFTSTQHSGMGPVAPPRGIPFGRFPPSGPPPRGQLNMTPVPPHIRHFQGMLLCEPLRPLSGGPRFQGPWPVGTPSGFAIRHPMLPLQGSDPRFQGQHYMGIPPPHPPST
ncbi:uncharacterized protein [Montipora capricornis]|uniref:uncharacterized protein n=1 Tax=Montipora capricornis TaxID=246305 RepID=UPI0035F1DBBE